MGVKQLLNKETGTIRLFKSIILRNSYKDEYVHVTSPLQSYHESYERNIADADKPWMEKDAQKWAADEKRILDVFDSAVAQILESLG